MPESLSRTQLVEALRGEQRQRWQEGERVLAETYLQQHPTLQTDTTCVLQLVYQEVLLREERGENPQLTEYLQRFPQFASQLTPLQNGYKDLANLKRDKDLESLRTRPGFKNLLAELEATAVK